MKVTRRALAKFAAAAAAAGAVHDNAQAQPPAAGRTETRNAEPSPTARQLSQVKLARAVEPATRFEA